MEIVCAGYPKTGSKSCSSALRILGYNVADYTETAGFLCYEWKDFLDGKTSIEPVIETGFDEKIDNLTNICPCLAFSTNCI